jgi:hypothetical protein
MLPFLAFVTFANGATSNYSLPTEERSGITSVFWWISSSMGISSIHFGGIDGVASTSNSFLIDNLIIASEEVPEPSTITIYALGLVGLALRQLRK